MLRAWHPGGIGPTAFLEALSAMAPVVEHKAVLFDVFHAARGRGLYTYAVRITGLWVAVVLLALALPAVCCRVLASAGAAHDLGAWRGLIRFVFGRGGMLRGRWRAAAYHRHDFHPWRYLDDRRFLSELRDTIVHPAWEVSARCSVPTGDVDGRPRPLRRRRTICVARTAD